MNGAVIALAVLDEDGPAPVLPALYLGGRFTSAAGLPVAYVARWGRPTATGDQDGDGLASRSDYAVLAGCLEGPDTALASSACCPFDFDYDEDTDLRDVAAFQAAFTTP